MNKTKLLEIAHALDLGSIDDKKERSLLLGLLGVSQQRELLIGSLEEYNKVKYEWTKLTYEDYVNKYHPNL
jgi:hypothetical protein